MLESDYHFSCAVTVIPFFHSFGFMSMFLNLIRGRKYVFLKKFNARVFLDAIVKYKVVINNENKNQKFINIVAGENNTSTTSSNIVFNSPSTFPTIRSFVC